MTTRWGNNMYPSKNIILKVSICFKLINASVHWCLGYKKFCFKIASLSWCPILSNLSINLEVIGINFLSFETKVEINELWQRRKLYITSQKYKSSLSLDSQSLREANKIIGESFLWLWQHLCKVSWPVQVLSKRKQ